MLYCSLRLLVLVRHHTLYKCCIVRYVYRFLSVTTHYRNVVLFAASTGSCPSPHIIEMLYCSLRLPFLSVTTHYRNVVLFATSTGYRPSPHIIDMLHCSLRLPVLLRHHTLQKCCIVRYVYWFLSVTTHYRNVILFATSTGSCPSPHIIEMLCCSLRLLVLVRHHTLQKCCVVRKVYWFLSVTTHYRNIVLFATSTGSCPSPHIIEMLCCSLRLLVLVRHHTIQKCCVVRYVYWFLPVTTHYRNVVLFATSTGSCPSPHIIEILCCSLRLLVLVRHHTLQKCCVVRYVHWFLSVTTHYRNVVLFATSTGSCPSPHIIEMLHCSLGKPILVRHHTLQKCCIVRYVYWFLSVTTHYRNVVLFATSTGSCPSPHIIEMLYCSLRLLVLLRHHTLQKCCIVRYVYWFLFVTTHFRNVILFSTSTGSCPSPHIIEMLCCSQRLLVLVRYHTLQKYCVVRYVYWFLSVTTHYRYVVLFATSTGSCPSTHIIEMLYCSLRLLLLVRHHTLYECCIVRYVYWFLSVTTHYRNVVLFATSTGSCPSPHIIEILCCSLRLLVLVRHHTLQICCVVRYVYCSCPSPHIIEMLCCSLRLLVLVRHHTLQKCCVVRYVYLFLSVTTHYRNVVLFATSTGSCPSPHIIEMLCCSLRLLVLVRHHTIQKCCVVRYVYWFLPVTTHYRNVVLFATFTGSCPSPHIIEMLCCSLRLLVLVRHHTLQKCCVVRYVCWFLSVTTHYRNVVLFATSTGSCPSPHIIEMLHCSLGIPILVRHHTFQKCCIVRYVYWFLSVTTHYRNVVLFARSTGSCPSPHIIEMLCCSQRLLVLVRHHTLQKYCVVRYVYWFLSVTTHYRYVVLFATSTVLVRHHTLQKCCVVRYVYWFLSVTTHYRNVVLFATSTCSCPSPHIIEMLYCSLRLLVLVRHHTLQKCCVVRYVYWFLSVTTQYRNVVLFATSTGSCPSPHIIEMLYCSLRLLVLVRHHTLQKYCVVRYVYWFLSVTTHYRNVVLFATSTGSCPSPHIIEMLYCSLRLLVLVRHHTLQKCCIVRQVYRFLSVTTHYRNVVLFATSTGSCPSPHIIEMLYCLLRLLVLVRHHTLQKCCIVRYVYWFLSVTTHYRYVVLFATSTGSCPSTHIIEMLYCSLRLLLLVRHHTLYKCCIVRYVYWFLSVTTHYRNVVLFATSTGSCPSPHIIEMLCCSQRLLVLVRHHTLQKYCVVRYVYWFLSVTTHYRYVVLFATSTVLVRHHTLQKCCVVRYVYWFLSVTTHYRNVVLFATSTCSCPSPHIIEMLYCSLRLLVLVRHHTLQKCCVVRYVYWFLSVTTQYRNVVLFATSTGSCPSPHIIEMLYCSLRLLVLVRHHTLQKYCVVRYVYWFLSVTTHYRNVVLFATSTGSCPSPHIIEMLYCSLRLLVLVRHHTLQKCCIVRQVYRFLSVTTHFRNVILFSTSTGSCPSPHIIEMLCCSQRLLVLVRYHTLQKYCVVRYVYWFLSVTTHYRYVVLFATSTGSCPSTHIIEMLYCSLRLLLLVRHHTLYKCCIVRYVYWFLSVTTHYRNVVLFARSTGSCPSPHIVEMLCCSQRLLVLVRHHTLQKYCVGRYVYWFLSVTTHYRYVVLFATSTVLVRHHTLQKCCVVRYVYWFLSVTTHYRNVVLFATSTCSCPSPHIIEMLYCSLRLLVLVRHHTLQKCCVVRYVYWFLSVTTQYRNVVLFATSTGSCPSPHIIEMLYCSLRLLVLVRHHTLQKYCVVRYVYWFLSVTTHYRNVVLFATSTGSCPSPHIIEMLYCSLRLLVLVRHHTLQKCCIVRQVYRFLSVTTHYRNVVLFATSTGSCPSPHIIEMLYCLLRLLVLVRHHTLQKCCIVRYVYWFFSVTTHYRNVVLFATSIGSCPSPHIIEMLCCSQRLLVLVRYHTLQKYCVVRYVYWFLSVTTHYRYVVLFATSTVLVRHHTLQKCCVVRYVYWFLSVTTHYRNVVLFATSTCSCPSPHIIEMLYCSLRLLVLVRHHTLQICCIVRYVYLFLSVTTHYRNVVLFATSTGSCPSPHIIEMLYCSLPLLVLVRHHTLQKCCVVRYVYWFLSVTTHYRNVVLFATSTGSCPSPHIIEMLYCSLRLPILVRHHTLQKCCIVRYVYWFLSVTTHYRNVVLFATSTGSCPSPHIIEMLYCSLRLLVLLRHHTLQKCCIVRYVYWFLSVTTHYRNVILFSTSTGSCPSPHIIEMLCCSLCLLVLVRQHTLQKCCIVRYVYCFLSVTTHYINVVLFATSTGSCPSPHIIEMLCCSLRLLVLVRHHTLQKCCVVRYVYLFLSVTTHYRNVVLFATSTGSSPSPHIIEMLYCSLRLLVLVRHHTLYKCCIVRYVYWFLSVTTHCRNVVLFATSTGSCPSPHIIEMLYCSLRLLVLVRHHTLQKCCIFRYVYQFLSVTTHYRNVILFATSTGSCPSPHII